MLQWSLDTSKGDPDLAREKIQSILHHTADKHEFSALSRFPKCLHGPIKVIRPWINAASVAFVKLKLAIFGKDNKNLLDLKHFSLCLQTSDIESFNSLILKYANKTYSYSQKRDAKGNLLYRIKKDRFGKKSVAPVKVEKDYKWQEELFDSCFEAITTGNIPQHQFPVPPEENKTDNGEFSKQDAIQKLQARMQRTHDCRI